MQIQRRRIQTHMQTGRLCCSGTNGFINFWLQFFDTRRETQFLTVFRNHTKLTRPPTFANTAQANTSTYANRQILLFKYERIINFWLQFFNTRREKQFLKVFRNHTMLTTPPTFANTTQANTNTNANRHTLLFRYERIINFWLQFFDTRREKKFLKVFRNPTMLTPPTTFSTSRGVLNLNSSSPIGTRKN